MIQKIMWRALTAAIACLLLIGTSSGPALADDEEGFRYWVEPIDLWILEQDLDTNSSKFEEYRDLSSGLWAGLKLYGESADGDRNLALRLRGIGRDDARYTLDYRLEGSTPSASTTTRSRTASATTRRCSGTSRR